MKKLIKEIVRAVIYELCIGLTKEQMLEYLRTSKNELIYTIRYEFMCVIKMKFLDFLFEKLVAVHVRKLQSLYSLIGHSMTEDDLEYLLPSEELDHRFFREDHEIPESENMKNTRLFEIDPDIDFIEDIDFDDDDDDDDEEDEFANLRAALN